MRIEEITKDKLSKSYDKELLILKLRFTQLWDKNFKGNDIDLVGSLNRNDFLKNYRLLLNEMNTRKIEKSTSDIDKAVFKKTMIVNKFGIDVSDCNDIVLKTDYIFISASKVNNENLDIIKRAISFGFVDENINNYKEPTEAYIPLYDLVLKAKQQTVIVEVSKPYPNEHSARLKDPNEFDIKSFRRTTGGTIHGSKKIPSTVSIIWAKLKGKSKTEDSPVVQSLRFPIKNWTVTKAKKWLSDNDVKFILFESATKKTKKIWSKKYIEALPDSAFLYVIKDENKRYFPYIDVDGKINKSRLQNVSEEISKSDLQKEIKEEVQIQVIKIIEDLESEKVFEKFVSVYPIDKADKEEHIVSGIVYEPDVVDAQGDKANEVEIRKAAYQFMEKVQTFKVMHKGQKVSVKVLESYIAPTDFTIATQAVKKGTWVLTVRILSKKIWKAIKDGTLTGFSMAGYASYTKSVQETD